MRLQKAEKYGFVQKILAAVLALSFILASASATGALSQSMPSMDAAAPADRMQQGWWAERHAAIVRELPQHKDAEVVLIGDSITNNYDKATLPDENFQPTWQTFYAPRHALNLGFSGDTAGNVLWRLQHGEVEGLHPKVVVLLIGTNDTGWKHHSVVDTQRGIDAVVADLERRLPASRILLLGLLPSAISAEKSAKDAEVNRYLATTYAANPRVTYLDIDSVFRTPDGALDTRIFYDPRLPGHPGALHPDTIGQRKMAEAIEPTLARLLEAPPQVPLDRMVAVNTAVLPVSRLEIDSYDWFARHQAALAAGRQIRPAVVMIGDSITHFWSGAPWAKRSSGPLSWQRLFGDAPVLNLGFGYDRTQNILWRLRQGELDGISPRWVVINAGTNNLTETRQARAKTPEETAQGIAAIVDEVRRKVPRAHIVLMAIFPRKASPDAPLRKSIARTNALLAQRYADGKQVTYLDIGKRFLAPDGTLIGALMPDGTHPSEAGYRIWADALLQVGVGGDGSRP